MKAAVTYESGTVFQHFGHTEFFKIYEIADGKITGSELISSGGSGHGALAGLLKEQGVNALICGGIGGGAKTALAEAGIAVYGGVSGDADKAAEDLRRESCPMTRTLCALTTATERVIPAETTVTAGNMSAATETASKIKSEIYFVYR